MSPAALGSFAQALRLPRAVDWRLATLLIVTSAALLALVVGFSELPMVDLPQHASQLATLRHWGDGADPDLELNLRTPYLLAYLLAYALAPLGGEVLALKLVVWLAAVANAGALAVLARRLGHDPWLAVLGLPTAFGYAFYFGFISFLLAVPFAVVCLSAALAHARDPNGKSGALLAAAACVTLFAHGVACAIALACTGPLLLRGGGSRLARLAPLAVPLLVASIWLFPGSSMARMGTDAFSFGWYRIVNLPAALVAFSSRDVLGLILGLCVVAVTLLGVGAPSRERERWVPIAVCLLGFCLFPDALNGYGFMSGRFAAFLVPALLIAFEPRADRRLGLPWRPVHRPLLIVLLAAWCSLFGVRLRELNRETRSWHALLERMPPGLRVRSIVFERGSHAFPGVPLFLHFAAYYHVSKGGSLGHSFTMYPNSVLRLRAGAYPPVVPGSEWAPETFDAAREAHLFDYFLVRSGVDRGASLFASAPDPIVLDAHEGDWWGYRPAPAVHRARVR